MPIPLVECVPNFSEARRPDVVEAIRQAITSVEGITVLDLHSDIDHNRTVITFVGSPESVEQAAFQAVAKAAELIDLDQHQGSHPRIGATDVLPIVPLAGTSMQECVEIARRVGSRVGQELGIPVYLYEQAATRLERQNLENIRRGQYEILKTEIATLPERKPDYGPSVLGKAGATVIGARPFLIAYNVYLTTDELQIAKNIARAIRYSSGGLRYVKALGMLVDGRAQVSMNLTDFHKTPLQRVVEMVRREAARYGVAIHHCELVGMIPQDALLEAAAWYLQLDQFNLDQVLERKLTELTAPGAILPEPEKTDFLSSLAAGRPTPGGGSAAAFTAAEAAALVAMVARLTLGKPKYAAVETQMQSLLDEAELLRHTLVAASQQDAAAFDVLLVALRLKKDTPEAVASRRVAIQAATLKAAMVPLEVVSQVVRILELAEAVVTQGNLNAITDGATAAILAKAALTSAGLNVRANLANLDDQDTAQALLKQLADHEHQAASLERKVHQSLQKRGGLSIK